MRFLLYNVRYGAGTGRGFHFPMPGRGYLRRTSANLRRITAFIQSHHPDVVGLVEVDGGSYRSHYRDQAQVVADAIGHRPFRETKYHADSLVRALPLVQKHGNAFLTRHAVQALRFHYLRHGIKRLVIELELEEVTFFLVHLSLTFTSRFGQLRDLVRLVHRTEKPHIVAGDFNPSLHQEELELFLSATGLRRAPPYTVLSYPSWAPRRQMDFVLCSPAIRIRRFSVPQITLSDHFPLICDFDIEK